jgi:hypothetical protein
MRAPDDRPMGPGPHDGLDPGELHSSDGWVLVDAVITIFTGVATILLVVLRHPFKVRHPFRLLFFAILIVIVGTIAGWWTP